MWMRVFDSEGGLDSYSFRIKHLHRRRLGSDWSPEVNILR